MTVLPVIKNIDIDFKSLQDKERSIYFDNNSTTEIDEDAATSMLVAAESGYGNPSTSHRHGRDAKIALESAREAVAKFMSANQEEVIFTSGGTESINTAINSAICTSSKKRIISCKTEHKATLSKLKSLDKTHDIILLPVDNDGRIDLNDFKQFINNNTCLVTLMAANNETGTYHNNLTEIIDIARRHGAATHIDAVQVAGKESLARFMDMGPNLMSISGHKFHAPKGIGALYISKNTPFVPLIFGGEQEFAKRAGTENVPSAIALGIAASKARYLSDELRDLFIHLLKNSIPSIAINGALGVANTVNVGFPGVHRDALVTELSNNKLMASTGSACTKGTTPSHVLLAMNISEEYIHSSVRFSFSKLTTKSEIEKSIPIIKNAYERILSISG